MPFSTCCICPCETCAVADHMFAIGSHCFAAVARFDLADSNLSRELKVRIPVGQLAEKMQKSGWIWFDICSTQHLDHLGGDTELQGQLLACLRWIKSRYWPQIAPVLAPCRDCHCVKVHYWQTKRDLWLCDHIHKGVLSKRLSQSKKQPPLLDLAAAASLTESSGGNKLPTVHL